jgi:hypothetical protein
MAVIKKTLFPKNLDKYSVLVNDTDPNSKYFKITELPDTFTGGKNAFLIAGSSELVADTKIQIELKDAAGNIIYHEPGEGYISSSLNGTPFVTEYYEGVSKVVSVYIYPDTAYGPCTITILGELNQYEDSNGIIAPVPSNWENQYNVKWTKSINVNPNLANTTKVRFYERPTVAIKEILSPIYRIENDIKVNSGISQSFANIKLSKLETFAGDVKRIKVFRTSAGDISDYDLIQDILVESKELLTSYGLTGSVVGQTGILTSETLKSFWNTGSLNAFLTSSRVESGVALNGSGNFTYTSSLDIRSANTYELNLDAFYSSSTDSNLGIYLASGSTSSSIATLYGTSPTKNLLDTVIPFKISTDYPTASLYFSQSHGEWHLGNISLKLSQDTAFSPDEISFITTMPTVIGNETFNFKFEFYDVNNNYVPVAVTQSATFTGGVNINNTLLLVSASTSQSLAELNKVSSSISGTMTVYSSSASSSVNVLSGSVSGTIGSVSSSVSGTIGKVSGSISGSIYSLSGSVSSSLTLTSGSITLVSSSLVFTSQSLSSSLTTLSASISSAVSYNASQSAYQVYSASQYLDKFIFTDENGKLNQPPTASSPGLYLGSEYLGYYNGTGTSGWKTYMDNQGDFYLTSSNSNGGFLAWNAGAATLQIQGAINIQGGNAATTSSVSASINSATASLSTSVATTTFTTATGLIAKPPSVLVGSTSGLYLGSTYLGYYDGTNWKTYMANNGNFYLSGTGTNGLTWNGSTLSITGTIKVSDGTEVTSATVTGAAAGATALQNGNTGKSLGLTGGSVGGVTIGSNKIYVGTGTFNNSNTGFYVDSTGQMSLKDKLVWDGSTLSVKGVIQVSDGTEVTAATVSGAASGATALQSGQTGKSLGLTGGSVGGVTIASNKIYVGTGTYGNANTGFYVDSSGNMSLKDKLTWDGSTLSITGNVVITGGATKTAIEDAASAASSAASAANSANTAATNAAAAAYTAQVTADSKITGAQVNSNVTSISGGVIQTNTIYANQIASLAFYGKTAQFDTGDIGGWTISGAYLGKDVGAGSGYGFKIDSTNKKISITDNATGIERVRIDPSTSIPPLTVSDTASIDYNHNTGPYVGQITSNAYSSFGQEYTELGTGGSSQYGTGYFGIIGLIYGNEEIWVDTSDIPDISGCVSGEWFANEEIFGSMGLWLKVQQYSTSQDAIDQTNRTDSWEILIAERTFYGYTYYSYPVSYTNKYGGTVAARGGGSGNTQGTAIWYRIEIIQRFWGYGYGGQNNGNQQIDGGYVQFFQYTGNVKVKYGRVGNGYSIFSPGGLQVYQGVRQYLNASPPDANSSNFFEVKGKSQFLSALAVAGDFSVAGNVDANVKQFKITHPLDDKQNLYHTSTEAPRADLIYRGKIQLENGIGSASIDIQSNMQVGTFDALTRDRQLYLQNNNSFDRVIGRIESGSIYAQSENTNSNTEIDWLVVAERCDSELLNSKIYDSKTGKYKTENYKKEIVEAAMEDFKQKFNSGSI